MNGLRRWARRRKMDRELAAEMESHIEECAVELMERGQSLADARRNARLRFGNVALQHESSREAWGWSGIESFCADLRFGARLLVKSPGYAAMAILTLALSIGASTAVFTVVDSVLLRPLGFANSGELAVAWERIPYLGPNGTGPNPRHVDVWKQRVTAFSQLVLLRQGARGVSIGSEHPRVTGVVTAEPALFDVLKVVPAMGRGFTAEDGVAVHGQVAVLTWALWRGWFNGDPGVIGQRIRVGDKTCEVVGVLPESFRFPNGNALRSFGAKQAASSVPDPGIFVPVSVNPLKSGWNGDYGNWIALGRLKAGTTLTQAQAQLSAAEEDVARQMGALDADERPTVSAEPLQEAVVGSSRRGLWLLMVAVLGLLLIACLNLASAQLGRALKREREVAVRSALGASKWRLLRAGLAENLLLAALGGSAGLAVAWAALRMFQQYAGLDIPRLREVQLDVWVLLFSGALTIGSSALFGLLPAIRSMRTQPQAVLQKNSSRAAGTRHGGRVSAWLIGMEMAGCAALLIVTALFGKSLLHLMRQDKGFETAHVAAAQVDLSGKLYAKDGDRIAVDERILRNLRALAGVEQAGLVSAMPLEGESWIEAMRRADRPRQQNPLLNLRWVSPGYFETLRHRLVAGRLFDDRESDVRGIVLSAGLAKSVWHGENALGGAVEMEGRKFTVIGIVADAHSTSLKAEPARMAYAHFKDHAPQATFFMVRGWQPEQELLASVRQAIWKAAPDVTLTRVKTLEAQSNDSIALERFQTLVLLSFGAAALALAMLGIYGVLSCSVTAKRQEIGVRMALGATKSRIYRATLREAGVPVATGLAAGLAIGAMGARFVESLLYGVRGVEPALLLGVAAVFMAAALGAAFVPARRAASLDPMEALRTE